MIHDDVAEQEWLGEPSEDDSTGESDQDDEDHEDDGEEEDEEEGENEQDDKTEKEEIEKLSKPTQIPSLKQHQTMTSEELKAQQENDPRPGESMADYNTRCNIYFQEMALKEYERTGKTLRRKAFTLAYERFLELRPVNEALERVMKENEIKEEESRIEAQLKKEQGISRNRNR